MTLVSLPVLLYLLPFFVLLTALVPQHRKQTVLAAGGVVYVSCTGGFPAVVLLVVELLGTWLLLRLRPARRDPVRVLGGLFLQLVCLSLAKALLDDPFLRLPLLICAMQNTEALLSPSGNGVPGLAGYCEFSCALPRMLAGPVLPMCAAERIWTHRKVTAERVGAGAALCIRGMFRLVCMASPMLTLTRRLNAGSMAVSAFDGWFSLIVFYFALYYGLRGAAELGQGIALMLGLRLPESFDTPALAGSLREFVRRFLSPVAAWQSRIMPAVFDADATGYFAWTAAMYGLMGLFLGWGVCGLLGGVLLALLLTWERSRTFALPAGLRRAACALAVLFLLLFYRSDSLAALGQHLRMLCGLDGIALTPYTAYALRTNWLVLLLCTADLLPLHRLTEQWLGKHTIYKNLAALLAGLAELCMVLFCMAELLSHYLR